jgi:hypothetical protein
MKSTQVEYKTPRFIEPKGASNSKGGQVEFFKSLDFDEFEKIDNIAKPPHVRHLQYFVDVGLSDNKEYYHRLKEYKYIPTLEIEKVCGK